MPSEFMIFYRVAVESHSPGLASVGSPTLGISAKARTLKEFYKIQFGVSSCAGIPETWGERCAPIHGLFNSSRFAVARKPEKGNPIRPPAPIVGTHPSPLR